MVKLPQVLAVMRAKSAEGLSLLAFELETLGFLIAATYGFAHKLAFTAYGETMVGFSVYAVKLFFSIFVQET